MSITNIKICRTCLVECPVEKVAFETVKDVFIDLTSLQVNEADELPKYICSKCGELLKQFQNFKATCIESDAHLRKTISNTAQLSLLPVELIKIESKDYDGEEAFPELSPPPLNNTSSPSKRTRAIRKISTKKQIVESSTSIANSKKKRRVTKKKKEDIAEVTTELESVKNFDGSDDEWLEPKVEPVKSSQPSIKTEPKIHRIHTCTVPKCQRKFLTEPMLEAHLKQHKGIDCTICDICERPLTSVTNMLRHRLTHRSVEEKSLKCTVCNKIMASESTLKYHMRMHESSKPFVCDMCGTGFVTSWGLKNHRTRHNTERTFQCEQCSKSFTTYMTLYRHIKLMHGKKDAPAECNICGTVVLSKRFLFNHCKNIHTVYTTSENIFECKQCGKKCKTIACLKQHEFLHTGERKFKCTLCPKTYNHYSTLKKHSYSHTGERPVHCGECGKGFLQKYSLDVHMNVHKKQWIAEGRQGITLMGHKKSTTKKKKKVIETTESEESSIDSS